MSQASETRVPCSKETRERLWKAKNGSETFDSLFNRLLDSCEADEEND